MQEKSAGCRVLSGSVEGTDTVPEGNSDNTIGNQDHPDPQDHQDCAEDRENTDEQAKDDRQETLQGKEAAVDHLGFADGKDKPHQTAKEEGDAGNNEDHGSHAGIRQAKTLIVAVSEEEAIPRIIHTARQLSPDVHILARTRHVRNAQHLLDLGADEVISEEFESALEIFTRALKRYQIPDEEVARIIERSKRLGTALFTRCTDPNQHQKIKNFETLFKATHVHTVRVEPGSAAEGKTIDEIGIKEKFGIREFGFRRGTLKFSEPAPTLRLEAGDTLVFFITDEKAGTIIPLFSAGNP